MRILRANIEGGSLYPEIKGSATFREIRDGVLVQTELFNMPPITRDDNKIIGPFAMHIHEGESCGKGNNEKTFPESGMHLNPNNKMHPLHIGDMMTAIPTSKGYVNFAFITDKFRLNDIIGHVVIVHESPDDFVSQPSGNSGKKIACGEIRM